MLIELVSSQLPAALLTWTLLYASDYGLSILASRMYQSGAHEILIYQGGIELTPRLREDVAHVRLLSPRWLLGLVVVGVLLSLIWVLSIRVLGEPAYFGFVMVGIILVEASIHSRHLRVLALYGRINAGGGPIGRVEYPRWLLFEQSAIEFAAFSGLYMLIFFLTGEITILGGAAFCSAIAIRHWLWGREALA